MKNYGEDFNIAHIEPLCHIYGPGKRIVIWFQGCALACEGCWNREMWSFKSNQLIHRQTLLKKILDEPDIDGITFLGGEPLHQSENLWWLFKEIRKKSDLTLFLFTGYEEYELQQQDNMKHIEQLCDIVAIGRYKESQRNTNQQWIGSDNQEVIYPVHSREPECYENINQVEIIIDDDESTRILGFPDLSLSII